MSQGTALIIFLILTLLAANLPWMSDRRFFVFPAGDGGKGPLPRLVELALMYGAIAAIGFGLEQKVTGSVHAQDWEFYAVTACLFIVFAMPGFIYRHIWPS
ncbi:MAG TPA: DUF2818 family protein [Chromatiaceae bacterium]|nr:DUF2818 family protein [Chromatiaceae bacterium]HIN81624.1 DUF2818 family protein [Chromatiales bacterium]